MTFPIYDDNLYLLHMTNDLEKASQEPPTNSVNALIAGNVEKIPPSSVVKQLAIALEKGKKFSSMKDLLASSTASSPIRDRAERSISVVKSLVLRGKDERVTPELGDDDQFTFLIHSLFDSEGHFLSRKNATGLEGSAATAFSRDIHGAPPESFVAKLSEVIGYFRSLKKMALFWCRIVAELRRTWSEEEHICGIPLDGMPDLDCCLLYQQLQVINSCISRKRRRLVAIESLDSASSNSRESASTNDTATLSPKLYARLGTGELVQRLGADRQSDDLVMLETGEPIYFPITQEGPLLTDDLIKETEEFVLQTGSVGAGCSHLLSDMQAFKAANPGCILEDFVRWHSPPDWTEADESIEGDDFFDGTDASSRGLLSKRMQKEGNLWLHLWKTAKPIPAVKQAPLFDEDLAVEGTLDILEYIPPFELFKQLFVSLLGVGFVVAEGTLSVDENFSKLFYECKDFVVHACQGSINEKVQDLCQVYETVESMLLNPEEVLKALKQQPEGGSPTENESRRRFIRIPGLSLGGKERPWRNPELKDGQDPEEKTPRTGRVIASFFRRKSFWFSRNTPKGCASPPNGSVSRSEVSWLVT
ncbi:rab3 GTPase-activating protein catalytic subunit-like isoform X2 [Punica granatum]|uniref:Rab3 GTPase-activating protein catalytic subunit-like isoform X2 n=1 Tax=Punica granatum TaxID=22663 RepID=A0A6P8C9Q7_PUNGR|nr:rab3 GTPase-activating protein catalytic subunit-like isoform X2 [Punica granatum]